MTSAIIITLSFLLLIAYVFDVTSARTRIPSVILLLLLGWIARQLTIFLEIEIPDLSPVLPVLGTIGLVLIVLEGSLELKINRSNLPIITKSTFIALLSLLLISFALGYAFFAFGGVSFQAALLNAIPYAIISSAIAIPSAKNLNKGHSDFITYESSLSDIFGVIAFNFIAMHTYASFHSVGFFLLDIVVILVISFIATVALAYLLSKIRHHVKFAPIILLIILIYAISKEYHLPALIFILIFGLFIENLDEMKSNRLIQKLHPEILNKEVHKFKELNMEMVFLIRSLFFLLFGYLIEAEDLLNTDTLIWALVITAGIFLLRFLLLKLFRLHMVPLLFIAPRGLITILLFLSIPLHHSLELSNQSLILQVIVMTALIMMYGSMKSTKNETGHTNYTPD